MFDESYEQEETTLPEIEFLRYRAEVKGDLFRQVHARFQEMKEKGLTQKQLAKRLGMNEGQLSKCLKGQRDFRLETLSDLARALGCRIRPTLEPLQKGKPRTSSPNANSTANVIELKLPGSHKASATPRSMPQITAINKHG